MRRVFDLAVFGKIMDRSEVLAKYVLKYFCDLERHIASLAKVLDSGAKVDYIVGNSKYYDTLVPSEKFYVRLFREHGFHDVSVSVLRKRSSKKELFEYRVEGLAS